METFDRQKVKLAILEGLSVTGTGPRCGCGRAYIILSKRADKKTLRLFKSVVEECGLRYIGKAYGTGDRAAYVGYDNGNGYPMAQAEAIAKNLQALGLDVYEDGVAD